MYQVVICDDDSQFREDFCYLFMEVAMKLSIEYNMIQCQEAEQVQEMFMKKERIDLLFLDIELENSLGIDLGRHIRENLFDFETQIVYVSHEQGYAMQLFETMPLDFLVKPVKSEPLKNVLRHFLKKQEGTSILFSYKTTGQGMIAIPYTEILYFQSSGHKLLVHTIKKMHDLYGKLEEIENQVPSIFIRIHKSYLVNIHFISSYRHDSVCLSNGHQLAISRSYKKQVEDYVSRRVKEM